MSATAIGPRRAAGASDWTWPIRLAVIATLTVAAAIAFNRLLRDLATDPETVTVPPGKVAYLASGEFLRDGRPVPAPRSDVSFGGGLVIMKRQVSRAEYDLCVEARACRPLARAAGPRPADTPAVGTSWVDATAYAAWLSRATGHAYRLPSDAEWVFAAPDIFRDASGVVAGDAANPATRWLQGYEREAARDPPDTAPLPFGSFGTSANGLLDAGGNVWEWTDTCFSRHALGTGAETVVKSCGVRVVEGAHRTYLTDFVRDARGGACSAGRPPANLGFRLVRDDGPGTAESLR